MEKKINLAVKGISNWRLTWVRLLRKLTWFQELKTSPISIPWKKSKLCCLNFHSAWRACITVTSLQLKHWQPWLLSLNPAPSPLCSKGSSTDKKNPIKHHFGFHLETVVHLLTKVINPTKCYHLSLFNQFRWFSNTKQVFQNSQQFLFTKSRYLVNCYHGPLLIVLLLMSCFALHTLCIKFLFIPLFTILCWIWVGFFLCWFLFSFVLKL